MLVTANKKLGYKLYVDKVCLGIIEDVTLSHDGADIFHSPTLIQGITTTGTLKAGRVSKDRLYFFAFFNTTVTLRSKCKGHSILVRGNLEMLKQICSKTYAFKIRSK